MIKKVSVFNDKSKELEFINDSYNDGLYSIILRDLFSSIDEKFFLNINESKELVKHLQEFIKNNK